MKIPKRFKLFGQTINVVFNEKLFHNDDVVGWAKYRQNEIELQPLTDDSGMTREMLDHAFCHELTHFLLYYGREGNEAQPLHKNEDLVDRISGLLHQVMTTMEYE